MAGFGVGASLASLGAAQKKEAIETAGKVADQEQKRNMFNDQLEAQRKSGNQQLGATVGALAGAQYGSALGPWGAVIGGVVGAVAGGLF
jgi:hypothetical protein